MPNNIELPLFQKLELRRQQSEPVDGELLPLEAYLTEAERHVLYSHLMDKYEIFTFRWGVGSLIDRIKAEYGRNGNPSVQLVQNHFDQVEVLGYIFLTDGVEELQDQYPYLTLAGVARADSTLFSELEIVVGDGIDRQIIFRQNTVGDLVVDLGNPKQQESKTFTVFDRVIYGINFPQEIEAFVMQGMGDGFDRMGNPHS